MNLSASQLGLYKHCPRAYRFKYIDGIEETPNEYSAEAMEFGKQFHSNIPELVSQDERVVKMIKALYNSKYADYNVDGVKFEDNKIVNMFGVNFRVILDGNHDDFILEFKTAKDPWTEDKFKEEIQSVIYQSAELAETGKEKPFIYFVVTKGTYPKVQVRVIENISKEKREMIEGLVKSLKEDFEFLPTAYLKNDCFFCGYKYYCETQF
jgi:CRISPR/Cas system-associated exonuclease Cas4 (RecB family)